MQQVYQKTGIPITRLLVLLLACFLIILCLPSATAQTFVINEKNGNKNAFSIEKIRKISFSSGTVHVSKLLGSDFALPISAISKLAFSDETIINELKEQARGFEQLLIFPNPVEEMLNIDIAPSLNPFGNLVIQTIDGKPIIRQRISAQNNYIQLDVSTLPSGLYLCHYNNGREVFMQKFIKK
jgi:hypothetical protein